ncbi:MAG: hypothetical protein M1814_005337 [Vezdaea aestivalis]|nr:MAG: hypothetical protein M1814_005337 [Vezdaea aestivalis]
MSSPKLYSVAQVLDLTLADIQETDFTYFMEIEGWENLSSDKREQCILKLRDLMHLRDGSAQSSAVDANALREKLSRVERGRSATPVAPPWDYNDPERVEEDWEEEKKSHEALIKDNGRPCYPIELEFDVFNTPGQHKDILNYWQKGLSCKRLIFSGQLNDWKEFRFRQDYDRQRFMRHDRFSRLQGFQQERRRKYGLDGDVHLCENIADQNKLQDWMEYQNYKLMKYERLEDSLKESQGELISCRKALAEEGYSAFEEIEDIEFGKYYGMCLDWSEKEGEKERKEELAKWKLKVAKTRLEVAQSEELGEMVERDCWIGWFEKEVISQQTRMDELQRLADEAKRDVEPYNQWFDAKSKEWDEKGWNDWTDEGDRLIKLETSSTKYRSKFEKRQELTTRASKASHIHFRARKEVEFAEKVLEVARTEDLAPVMERTALIKRIQKEVRFAEFHLEEEKESTRVMDLKSGVISALGSITSLKEKMKSLKVLLDWIEEQRRELVDDDTDAGQKSGPRRPTRVNSRAHPSPRATRASKINHHGQKRAFQQNTTTKSILDPVNPAKISKTPRQSRKGRREASVRHDISLEAEKTTVNSNIAEPKSDTAISVKDGICARLRPVHSSRISKPTSKGSIGRRRDTTGLSSMRDRHQRTRKELVDMPTSSMEVVTTTLRRSTRRSKPSQSHRLGSK